MRIIRHIRNPLVLSNMASFDTAGLVYQLALTRHVLAPRFLSQMASYDVADDMCCVPELGFLFLLHQWSDPMELTPVSEGEVVTGFEQMGQAVMMEKVFAEFFHTVKGALRATPGGYSLEQEQTWGDAERALSEAVDTGRAAVGTTQLSLPLYYISYQPLYYILLSLETLSTLNP